MIRLSYAQSQPTLRNLLDIIPHFAMHALKFGPSDEYIKSTTMEYIKFCRFDLRMSYNRCVIH